MVVLTEYLNLNGDDSHHAPVDIRLSSRGAMKATFVGHVILLLIFEIVSDFEF
jgi:hypothetical protein